LQINILLKRERYLEGSWYGNDTLWRTIADLNQIILYADKSGNFGEQVQRKMLYFCDGIISGESEGPLRPTPKKTGILLAGTDPVMIDLAIAELLNFNFQKIPQLSKILNMKKRKITKYSSNDMIISSNYNSWNGRKINEIEDVYRFLPSKGWKNYIEK
jgi:hypothetical protein